MVTIKKIISLSVCLLFLLCNRFLEDWLLAATNNQSLTLRIFLHNLLFIDLFFKNFL